MYYAYNYDTMHFYPMIYLLCLHRQMILFSGFTEALEIMENLENHPKKFHAWKNHGL